MLNFKSSSVIFLVLVILCGLLHYAYGISLWWLAVPVLVFKAAVIYGSATIRSSFFTEAHCSGKNGNKEIAVTFDDGPDITFTPQIMAVLAEFRAPATFFVIGKNIPGNETLLRQMDAAGHTIGNHTYSHSFFIDFKSRKGFIDELNRTLELVYKATGRQMKLFRPPYGVTTPNLAKAARDLGYAVTGWNVRSLDTKKDSIEQIAGRVKKQLKPGAVILFHDTSAKTVEVLRQTLTFAAENGFKIVSAGELLNLKAYES